MKFCILKVLPTGIADDEGRFAPESNSEIAPHKQGNKRWRGIPTPLDERKMCVHILKLAQKMCRRRKKSLIFCDFDIQRSEQFYSANIPFFSVAISCFL